MIKKNYQSVSFSSRINRVAVLPDLKHVSVYHLAICDLQVDGVEG